MAEIFVVDDDLMLQKMLVTHLERSGHRARAAGTLAEGLKEVAEGDYDVVFLDVQLPDGDGLEQLTRFKAVSSAPEVIIITGKGDEFGAEKAILSGAWGYIEKPDVIKDLLLHLTRALQFRQGKNRVEQVPVSLKREAIIGNSQELNKCLDQVAQIAASDASVLITGETGTGKELFARAIHENSGRAGKKLVTVDCAALPENLIESILFGHVKGAFTGADTPGEGLVGLADGGTLFLDEVGELSLAIQKTFLRVLQEQSYRPVGSTTEKHSDFRVIAATNVDIDQCVAQGAMRSDLLYRLRSFSLCLPPLRERKEDIKPLTSYFLAQICDQAKVESKGVSPDFSEHLTGYDWPGNVRELRQVMEQVIAFTPQAPTLFAANLPEHFRIRQAKAGIQPVQPLSSSPTPVNSGSEPEFSSAPPSWHDFKNSHEQRYIAQLMEYAQDNITVACQISGLSRTRLYQLRGKYGLK
ncbi:MAG: sigma-54 dependent transcriptional regulator [Thermodesulfobacteriota bacterium]